MGVLPSGLLASKSLPSRFSDGHEKLIMGEIDPVSMMRGSNKEVGVWRLDGGPG